MHMRSIRLAAVLAFVVAGSAQATVIFNNFGPGNSFGDSGRILQGEAVNNIGNIDQAVSFTVGASDFNLSSLSLGIDVSSSPFDGRGPLDLILAGDSGGLPGAAIETIPLNVGSAGKQVVTGNSAGGTLLLAGTTYWIVADAKGKFNGAWNFNSIGDTGKTAGRAAPVNSFNYSPWNLRSSDDRMALRVEGEEKRATVPDSGSTFMAIVPLLGLAWFARKRIEA